MIERWWLLLAVSLLTAVFVYIFYRYGAVSKRSLVHPLARMIILELPQEHWSRRHFYFLLCGSLFFLGLAASGPRWGVKTQSEFHESRVIALTIDRSGSISEEQEKLIISAVKNFMEKFRQSATVTIVPFADKAGPSPLFTLAISREYNYALAYLDNMDKINVGGGTEGGWAFYQTFEKLMAPLIFSEKFMRREILPRLKNREIKFYESDLAKTKKCPVRDRAVIMGTDAEFNESDLHSAEVLELYRICGVRVYLMSIKGKDPEYLRKAVEATFGKFKFIGKDVADSPVRFKNAAEKFFNDILAIELSSQKIRESTTLISRSWIFAAIAIFFGALTGATASYETIRAFFTKNPKGDRRQ